MKIQQMEKIVKGKPIWGTDAECRTNCMENYIQDEFLDRPAE